MQKGINRKRQFEGSIAVVVISSMYGLYVFSKLSGDVHDNVQIEHLLLMK